MMLRANVGLSRKISRDYNSTGYSVNLDGEIPVSIDEPEAITEKIKELFSLAQEALTQEIDRDQGEDAIGRRDEERPASAPKAQPNGNGNGHADRPSNGSAPRSTPTNNGNRTNGGQNGNGDAATNKQVQFLLTMGKRFKLSTPQLENRVAEIIGRRCGVYDLTKKEAGLVLDHFTKDTNGTSNGNGNGRQAR
ncbi:MAG: hypothetical protein ACK4RK_09475 [Gemmataceae bacterium]